LHFSVAEKKEAAEVKAGKNRRPSYIHVYNAGGIPGDGASYQGSNTNPLLGGSRRSSAPVDMEEARRSISLQKFKDGNKEVISRLPVDGGNPDNATTPYAPMK
jgi:hypothetical protein